MDLRKKMPGLYKSYSQGERLEDGPEAPEAPMPAFGLSEERAASPEYQEAKQLQDEGIRGYIDRSVNDKLMADIKERNPEISDEEAMQQIASMEQIASAGQMAGSIGNVTKMIPNMVRAESAAEGLAKAASKAPARFGKIINVIKERAPFVSEKVVPVGKVIRAKK